MNVSIIVHNIKCGGCANSIKTKLSKIDGISDINISIEEGKISFDSPTDLVTDQVRIDLKNMGYTEDDPNLLQSAKSYVSCMIGRMQTKES